MSGRAQGLHCLLKRAASSLLSFFSLSGRCQVVRPKLPKLVFASSSLVARSNISSQVDSLFHRHLSLWEYSFGQSKYVYLLFFLAYGHQRKSSIRYDDIAIIIRASAFLCFDRTKLPYSGKKISMPLALSLALREFIPYGL